MKKKHPVGILHPPEWMDDKALAKKLDDAIRKKYPDSPEVAQVLAVAKSIDLACDKIAKAYTRGCRGLEKNKD